MQIGNLTGSSLSESCEGEDELLKGGYQVTRLLSQTIPRILAIEDTTTLLTLIKSKKIK
jgi:hypothetical protein